MINSKFCGLFLMFCLACTQKNQVGRLPGSSSPTNSTAAVLPQAKAESSLLLSEIQNKLQVLNHSQIENVKSILKALSAQDVSDEVLLPNLNILLKALTLSDAAGRSEVLKALANQAISSPKTPFNEEILTQKQQTVENTTSTPGSQVAALPEVRTSSASPVTTPTAIPPISHISCGNVEHGGSESRVRFLSENGSSCSSEFQTRTCSEGVFGIWSGAFSFASCTVNAKNQVAFSGKFQNDSIYTQARFDWVLPAGWDVVRLGFSSSLAALNSWDGSATATLVDGGVISSHAQCSGDSLDDNGGTLAALYNPGILGSAPLSLADKCAVNLSSTSPWSKRYFKLYTENSSQKTFSPVRTSGNVAPGMVLVAKEDWPDDEFSATDILPNYTSGLGRSPGVAVGPFDFAIDKYELSGTLTECLASGALFPCSGSVKTTETGKSEKGAFPVATSSWNTMKQACLNRSFDSSFTPYVDVSDLPFSSRFTGPIPQPMRKIHMLSDLEFYVSSKDTPEQNMTACNISGNLIEASGSRSACVSRYGARDLIGNLWESTDAIFPDSNSTKKEFFGTTLETNPAPFNLGISFHVPGDDGEMAKVYFRSFDQINQFASSGPSLTLETDPLGFSVAALWAWWGFCDNCTASRGGGTFGHNYSLATQAAGALNASRTSYFIDASPQESLGSQYSGKFGSRCALVAP